MQTSILPLISPAYATGDILLMFILTGAVVDGFFDFLWCAVFAGIIYDLVSYTPVGAHVLIFLFIVYFVSFFSRRFSIELKGVGLVLFLIFVIVATLLSRGVMTLLDAWELQTFSGALGEFGSFKVVVTQIILNIFLFFFTFIIFRKTKKVFNIE